MAAMPWLRAEFVGQGTEEIGRGKAERPKVIFGAASKLRPSGAHR